MKGEIVDAKAAHEDIRAAIHQAEDKADLEAKHEAELITIMKKFTENPIDKTLDDMLLPSQTHHRIKPNL